MRLRLLSLFALGIALAACTNDFDETAGSAANTDPFPGEEKIVNLPDGASAGVLAVKFSEESAAAVEEGATRSGNTRTGIETVDRSLEGIDASRFSRLFTDPLFEDRLRAAGLHRWYMIRFDESVELRQAARMFCASDAIATVEYMHPARHPSEWRTPTAAEPVGGTRATALPQNDPGLGAQWHYDNTGSIKGSKEGADINLFAAWEICSGDESIVVAVFDEPVDETHEDLAANLWVNTIDSDSKYLHGANFVTYESEPIALNHNFSDNTGHGTHVAGTIAAVNGNGKGVCGIAGGRDGQGGVKIMSCQVFDRIDVARSVSNALIWAANRGAHIAQCSLGWDPRTSESEWQSRYKYEMEAIDYFIEQPRTTGPIEGGLVIFAAGNDGNSQYLGAQVKDMRIPPACYASTVAVAATSPDYLPASYTCYGNWVDISAPGGNSEAFGEAGTVYSTLRNNTYGYIEGTSMACPHVSGVAALGLSYAAKLGKRYSTDEFRSMLLSATDYIDDWFTGRKSTEGYNYDSYYTSAYYTLYMENYKGKMGSGQTDAYRMLMQVEGTPVMTVAAGRENEVPLTGILGGAAGADLTILDTDGSAAKLGMTYAKSGQSLIVSCTETGCAKLTLRCTVGETPVEREVAIISRKAVAGNSGWL